MVGAPLGGPAAPGGAVHVFTRTGSTWMEEESITPADAASGDGFGSQREPDARRNARARVRARSRDRLDDGGRVRAHPQRHHLERRGEIEAGGSGSAAIAGDGTRAVLASSTTEVRVHARSGSTWTLEQDLVASQPIYAPTVDLSADGSRALVSDWNCSGSGNPLCRVFVFERTDTTWSETQLLTSGEVPDGTLNGDAFGFALAQSADGQRLVIGALGSDAIKPNHGLVHIYVASGGAFAEEAELSSGDAPAGDAFGNGVAVDAAGTRAIVGAPLDDLPRTGIRAAPASSTWTAAAGRSR